ncbi:retron St85 family effector protein [Clostridium chromiireducens]|uniref:Uncharacterized protein n=1 Tax=Clostridium chromiireducens TaxID=225345 RepID=A0A1V4I693_9CLOT|nr:retron St85 family effector protein [Clostridium chromiireducens]OPJ55473.1 hypothetical protein CLCHR_46800 [Clostridium chromiireducens]
MVDIKQDIAKIVYNEVFSKLNNEKISVCLLGANAKDAYNLRNRLRNKLIQNKYYTNKIDVYYPEEIFSDLLYNKKIDLLSLENLLAKSIDVFIICLEGDGAIAELGAFTNHDVLSKKLIVVIDEKYKKQRSFIRNGPIRYLELKRKPNPILWFNYQERDIDRLTISVRNLVSKISLNSEVERNLHNPIAAEEFLLLVIYILDSVSSSELINYINEIGNPETKEIASIVCTGAISSLFRQREVLRKNNEYKLTKIGYDRIIKLLQSSKRKQLIGLVDNLRIDYMNKILRMCK